MTQDEAKAAAAAVTRIAARMAENPHLAAELQRARREFFGRDFGQDVANAQRLRGAADTAELRFTEWLVLERVSELLGAVPIEVATYAAEADDVVGSLAGVFLIAIEDGICEARDLQDETVHELAVPAGSLAAGDLVVGRLYASEVDTWVPSIAAAVFRPGAELGQAFQRDVERLDLDRRLQQIELEHLLLAREANTAAPTPSDPPVPIEHLEADLDRLLRKAGATIAATTVSEQLSAAERPGLVMGPLLDTLAFDTDVDLDALRRLLLELWNAHHATGRSSTPPPAPAEESLGERLVRTLDEGLRQKRDVEDLFQQLERMAGIEPDTIDEDASEAADGDGAADPFGRDDGETGDDDDDDEAESRLAPAMEPGDDLGGDLEPLVQEYLWESGLDGDPRAAPLHLLIQLQQNAPLPRTDLEQVTGDDLMRLLLHVYLSAAPRERPAAVRAAYDALRAFYGWAARTQEFELNGALQRCSGALLEQLDRLDAAGAALSSAHDQSLRPRILAVEEVGPRGFGVRDDDGDTHWVEAGAEALRDLRAGDLVLGALLPKDKKLRGLVIVLPADARALIE